MPRDDFLTNEEMTQAMPDITATIKQLATNAQPNSLKRNRSETTSEVAAHHATLDLLPAASLSHRQPSVTYISSMPDTPTFGGSVVAAANSTRGVGHKRARTNAYSGFIPAPAAVRPTGQKFVSLDYFNSPSDGNNNAPPATRCDNNRAGSATTATWLHTTWRGTEQLGCQQLSTVDTDLKQQDTQQQFSTMRVSSEGRGRLDAARQQLTNIRGDDLPSSPPSLIDARVPSVPSGFSSPTHDAAETEAAGGQQNDRPHHRRVTFAEGESLAVVVGTADADVDRTPCARSQPARALSAEELLKIRMHTFNTVMAYRAMVAGVTPDAAVQLVRQQEAAQAQKRMQLLAAYQQKLLHFAAAPSR